MARTTLQILQQPRVEHAGHRVAGALFGAKHQGLLLGEADDKDPFTPVVVAQAALGDVVLPLPLCGSGSDRGRELRRRGSVIDCVGAEEANRWPRLDEVSAHPTPRYLVGLGEAPVGMCEVFQDRRCGVRLCGRGIEWKNATPSLP